MTIDNDSAIPTDHPGLTALRKADEALEWLRVSIASPLPITDAATWRLEGRIAAGGRIPLDFNQYPAPIELAIGRHVAGGLVSMATRFRYAADELERLAAEVNDL